MLQGGAWWRGDKRSAAGGGNWGGIAHTRPVQCLLNPTPPCDLDQRAPAHSLQCVVGIRPEPRCEGRRSSGLHRTPYAVRNTQWKLYRGWPVHAAR